MQFMDLAAGYRRIADAADERLRAVLESGRYIMGPQVAELERRLADFVGRRYCVTCSSGTDALILPLLAMGVGAGDAVFVPDFTFFATAEAVAAVGAVPVFVDICPDTFNMDAAHLETVIAAVKREGRLTPKGVIPVDLFGLPADYDAIGSVAARHGLWVLEDGAQGFGGTRGGKRACSFGQGSATSFFPAKPLGCYGDGGAVFTDDPAMKDLLCSLRVHGSDPADKYDNLRVGRNARLDTLQAAILLARLDVFDRELAMRQAAAAQYTRRLAGAVATPQIPADCTSSFAQYTLRMESADQRRRVMAALKEQDIPTMIYYPRPLHAQTALKGLPAYGACPQAERACETVLSLPLYPDLTEPLIDRVCDALLAAL